MVHTYLAGQSDVVINSQKLAWETSLNQFFGIETPELRVATISNPPYVVGRPLYYDVFGNEHVEISGPLYALLKEICYKINYT